MSISDKLTYLNTTKGKIKDSINLTGAGITTEPFRQYAVKLKDAYVDIINNGTDTLYNNFPKVSGTGESLNLQDTYEAPMQIDLKGNTSQEGTPTPDSPQDIHNVSGNNSIVVCGKNLFDKDNITTLSAILSTYNHKIETSANGKTTYIKCLPNTTYTISKVADVRFQVATTSEVPAISVPYNDDYIANDTGNKITITTSANAKYLVIYYWHNSSTRTEQAILDTLQVEKGNITNPTYEAYNGTTYPINLGSMELCKIGDYQDYIYKEDDKWYLHKETRKIVLDGSETGWSRTASTMGYYSFYKPRPTDSLAPSQTYYCNYFKPTIAYGNNNNTTYIGNSNIIFSNVLVNGEYLLSLDDFKAWLSTHNIIVNYILTTPTNTEITDITLIEQLNDLENAKSKNGTTNINQENNDLPFIIDASALEKE